MMLAMIGFAFSDFCLAVEGIFLDPVEAAVDPSGRLGAACGASEVAV